VVNRSTSCPLVARMRMVLCSAIIFILFAVPSFVHASGSSWQALGGSGDKQRYYLGPIPATGVFLLDAETGKVWKMEHKTGRDNETVYFFTPVPFVSQDNQVSLTPK